MINANARGTAPAEQPADMAKTRVGLITLDGARHAVAGLEQRTEEREKVIAYFEENILDRTEEKWDARRGYDARHGEIAIRLNHQWFAIDGILLDELKKAIRAHISTLEAENENANEVIVALRTAIRQADDMELSGNTNIA